MAKKIHVYDFFSGCGGTSVGLKAVGMEIIFGLDIDLDSANTFKMNNPFAHFINGDIKDTHVEEIKHLVCASTQSKA
ncbi:DNA cytosine methyltransferase, partial [Escherichia coli]